MEGKGKGGNPSQASSFLLLNSYIAISHDRQREGKKFGGMSPSPPLLEGGLLDMRGTRESERGRYNDINPPILTAAAAVTACVCGAHNL